MTINLDNYLERPPNIMTEAYKNGDTTDIVKTVLEMDAFCAKNGFLNELAKEIKGRTRIETLKSVFNLAKENLKYKIDKPGHEIIKSSVWMLYFREGDCKSYSVLIGDFLRALNIPFYYRFVSQDKNDKTPTHVYVVVKEKGEVIVLDAIDKYLGFNQEVNHNWFTDIKGMTRISMIHGIKQESVATVAPKPFFNYLRMTSGELKLNLIKDQLNILSTAHPESQYYNSWQKGIDLINDTIYKGVHGLGRISLFTGIFDSQLYPVAEAIREAETRIKPASKLFAFDSRSSVIHGIDPALQIEDAKAVCNHYLLSQYGQSGDVAEYNKCIKLVGEVNADKALLNDKFEDSAHFQLFEFVSNKQISDWSPVDIDLVKKVFLHKSVCDGLSYRTEIDRDNLVLWMRNGVMRNNAKSEKLAYNAFSPEDTILFLMTHPELGKYNVNGTPQIGLFGLDDFLVCVAIAIIIATAGGVAIDIIRTIQGKDPAVFKDVTAMITGATMAATGQDFSKVAGAAAKIITTGSGTTQTGTGVKTPTPVATASTLPSWALPAAAVAAGLILYKNL